MINGNNKTVYRLGVQWGPLYVDYTYGVIADSNLSPQAVIGQALAFIRGTEMNFVSASTGAEIDVLSVEVYSAERATFNEDAYTKILHYNVATGAWEAIDPQLAKLYFGKSKGSSTSSIGVSQTKS